MKFNFYDVLNDFVLDIIINDEESEIIRSIEKRCKTALEHIADGLSCLKYFDSMDTSNKKVIK